MQNQIIPQTVLQNGNFQRFNYFLLSQQKLELFRGSGFIYVIQNRKSPVWKFKPLFIRGKIPSQSKSNFITQTCYGNFTHKNYQQNKYYQQLQHAMKLTHLLFQQIKSIDFVKEQITTVKKKNKKNNQQLFKDWFQYYLLRKKIKKNCLVKQQLCRRNIKGLVSYFTSNNQPYQAQISSKIQDKQFRRQTINLKTREPNLSGIFRNNFSIFAEESWMTQLALQIWYNFSENFIQILQKKINEYKARQLTESKIYIRIFSTLLALSNSGANLEFNIDGYFNYEEQVIFWILSNILMPTQIRIYPQKQYEKFRIHQVVSLISKTGSVQQKFKIINLDNCLSADNKYRLKLDLCRRVFNTQQFCSIQQTFKIQQKNIWARTYFNYLIYNFRELQALQYLESINQLSVDNMQIEAIALELIPYIFSCDANSKLRYLKIIKQIKKQQIELILIEQFLVLWFHQQALCIAKLQDILQKLLNCQLNDKIRRFIIQFLLKQIISNEKYFSVIFYKNEYRPVAQYILEISQFCPLLYANIYRISQTA